MTRFGCPSFFIPSSYAPCLLTHPALLTENPAAVRAFLAASAEGWALACKDPAAAAADLVQLAKVRPRTDEFTSSCKTLNVPFLSSITLPLMVFLNPLSHYQTQFRF